MPATPRPGGREETADTVASNWADPTTEPSVSNHPDEYIAWSWAVNGFFSVIGSVLTTILSMSYGFNTVQYMALVVYGIAALAYTRIGKKGAQAVEYLVAVQLLAERMAERDIGRLVASRETDADQIGTHGQDAGGLDVE